MASADAHTHTGMHTEYITHMHLSQYNVKFATLKASQSCYYY